MTDIKAVCPGLSDILENTSERCARLARVLDIVSAVGYTVASR